MTEERKQKLRQLLSEAMKSLKIRDGSSFLPIKAYRTYLRQRRTFYWVHFNPYVVNETAKSKLLDFIRGEFAPFIREDRILSACYFLHGGPSEGFPLDDLLSQLLKIAIAHGTEGAVSAFDQCTIDKFGSVQYIALLEGIKLKTELQVFDGIRLVPLSNSALELPRYLSNINLLDTSVNFFLGKTLLIVDCSVSPIFHKPFGPITIQEYDKVKKRAFQIEVSSKDFPHLKVDDFPVILLCQALALACNSAVEISLITKFLTEDKLYNLNFGIGGGISMYRGPFRNFAEAGQSEIKEAKRLYKILTNLNSKSQEKLQIPINRWIKSKANKDPVDKIIDLAIALEALYLPDQGESTFKLAVRASWYLGENKKDRKELFTVFREFYKCRSAVVHGGDLDKKKNVTIEGDSIPISKFITRTQDLCQESIEKIMQYCSKEGKFPKNDYWDSLILG